MRFNILGFDQVKAFKAGLTLDELMILRHLHDFTSSGKMEIMVINSEIYYWVKYDKFIDDLPILNMKKTRLMEIFNYNLSEKPNDWEERLNSMSDSTKKRANSYKFTGVVKGYTKKDKTGTYSYFAFTKKFYDLLPPITSEDTEMKKAPTAPTVEAKPNKNNLTNNITQNNKNYTGNNKKNRFHNTNDRVVEGKYTNEDLEAIIKDKTEAKFKPMFDENGKKL